MNIGYVIKHVGGALVFFSIIFISAGHVDYWQGLLYLAIGLVMSIVSLTLLRPDTTLQHERSAPGKNIKTWDKVILGLSLLTTISMYVVAGLDSGRFHWSPDFPLSVILLGALLTGAGQLLFLIAQKQNKFFSSVVRIQSERDHKVCDTGLYASVRHPAYMGSLIQVIGFPLIFGSMWSVVPVCVSIVLLIARTYLEDRTLYRELPGYQEYTARVRYRLIPLVW